MSAVQRRVATPVPGAAWNLLCARFMAAPHPLHGTDAALLLRLLAVARERQLPLSSALPDRHENLPAGLRRAVPQLAASGEADLLDALTAALAAGRDRPAAAMLTALRAAGTPAAGLRELAAWLTARQLQRGRLLRQITYPITLAVMATVLFTVVYALLFVPVIAREAILGVASVSQETGVSTGIVGLLARGPGAWLERPAGAIVYGAVMLMLVVFVVRTASRVPVSRLGLWLPWAHAWARMEAAQSFCLALAVMLRHGRPLPESVAIAAGAVTHPLLGQRLAAMAPALEQGASFGEAIRDAEALPPPLAWRLWSAYFRSDLVAELERVAAAAREDLEAEERRMVAVATAHAWAVAFLALLPAMFFLGRLYGPMIKLFALIG